MYRWKSIERRAREKKHKKTSKRKWKRLHRVEATNLPSAPIWRVDSSCHVPENLSYLLNDVLEESFETFVKLGAGSKVKVATSAANNIENQPHCTTILFVDPSASTWRRGPRGREERKEEESGCRRVPMTAAGD